MDSVFDLAFRFIIRLAGVVVVSMCSVISDSFHISFSVSMLFSASSISTKNLSVVRTFSMTAPISVVMSMCSDSLRTMVSPIVGPSEMVLFCPSGVMSSSVAAPTMIRSRWMVIFGILFLLYYTSCFESVRCIA